MQAAEDSINTPMVQAKYIKYPIELQIQRNTGMKTLFCWSIKIHEIFLGPELFEYNDCM
jgi:hypothetical protein